jgi:O-antigen/teichoic acid export membrane protein
VETEDKDTPLPIAGKPFNRESANSLRYSFDLKGWFHRNRSSTRVAFALQTVARLISTGLSLLWTPLLLHAMDVGPYGLFLSFQGVATLGGLGDLGMGGAIALNAGRFLGRGDERGLLQFLKVGRTVFCTLAAVVGLGFLLSSPWLPTLLRFSETPTSGSLPLLFAIGAPVIAFAILGSYFANLNYALLNLTWPIVPTLLIGQAGILTHWLLARNQQPLPIQYLAYVISGGATCLVSWILLQTSHPRFATLSIGRVDWAAVRVLLGQSGWVYLISVGSFVYSTTDRLLINAFFGPEAVPRYQLNYKVCELALFLIIAASFVSMPKLTQWLASVDLHLQQRARLEAARLNRIICFLGGSAAVIYLGLNDEFIRIWLGAELQAPLLWQIAFAMNLAITAGTSVALDLSVRLDQRGLRFGGQLVAVVAALNLILSFIALLVWRSALGVALATVAVQWLQTFALGNYVCSRLQLSNRAWLLRSCVFPILAASAAGALRFYCQPLSGTTWFLYGAGALALIVGLALVNGINRAMLREEWQMLTGRGLKPLATD